MSVPRIVLVLAVAVAAVVAAGIVLVRPGEPERPRPEPRADRAPPRPEEPSAPEIAPLPPDPVEREDPERAARLALWDEAVALLEADEPIEALERIRRLREESPAFLADPDRAAVVTRMEVAAVNLVAKALSENRGADAVDLADRLEELLPDTTALDSLRAGVSAARVQLERGVRRAEMRVVQRGRTREDRAGLETHLRRFGSLPPSRRAGPIDRRLREVSNRESIPAEPLPVEEPDEAEKRRLEQLDKLRRRNAVGLLDNIASGLAWLALHQGADGEFSDGAAHTRCVAMGHKPDCIRTAGKYPVASTGLAVLAYLDFRDQDTKALFEPTLAAGVAWLLKNQKADGSFPAPRGYSNGIALMALGQAAAASGREDIKEAVRRGLLWMEKNRGPDGGFRYRPKQAGDLSVTGWMVQAVEAAETAGIEPPGALVDGLREFFKWTWQGDASFSYLARGTPRSSLAPVGMLTGSILEDPSIGDPTRNAWRGALMGQRRPSLYSLYYGVRVLLALDGKLPKTWNDLVADLAKGQLAKGHAAGSFSPKGRWTLRERTVTTTTAFSLLVLEHSLYRR